MTLKLNVRLPLKRTGRKSPHPCPVCKVKLTHLVSSHIYVCDSGKHQRQSWKVTERTYNRKDDSYVI